MEVTVHGVDAPAPAAVPQTASQEIIKAANATAFHVDGRGRKIVVKVISALNLYRLTKIMGEAAANTVNLAMTAASVVEIDGEGIPFPTKEPQIEAMIARLDFEGLDAASKALKTLQPAEAAEGEDTAKN